MNNKTVKILYTNWQGETSVRTIIPKEMVFTADERHPEPQWCIIADDVDKKAERTFTCKNIKAWFTE